MSADKKTIGVSKSNSLALAELVRAGRFVSELDAAKFAMAVAIKRGTAAGITDGAETKWNVGSIDPDGTIRSLLEALYPAVSEPYRLLEYLINEGVKILAMDAGGSPDVYDFLFSE
jgi:hypothetical protein